MQFSIGTLAYLAAVFLGLSIADQDPVLGTPDERFLTGCWADRRVGRPEASTFGLTFSRGGYAHYVVAFAVFCGLVFGLAALRYGDRFWYSLRNWLWW